jgi:hypothetical protein
VTSSSGDNNGYETSAINAYADDSVYAQDNNSGTTTSTSYLDTGKDRHTYYNYGLNIPVNASIQGIEIRLDAWADKTQNTPLIYVQLSWDGGNSWTNALATSGLGRSQATFIVGSDTNLWGRSWSPSDLSDANFRVRLIDVSSSTIRDFRLDWVAIQVTYIP